MAPSESVSFTDRGYAADQTAAGATPALRQRMPVVLGIMVALPISLLLWIAVIVGLRAFL